ncbi:large ATP-binding protein [Amycolatopsis mediterranei S699]|uniref:Large ATP-binding protein n=1 Tax=Amycolatopsis mediterranei (strain U-32) TaxID=749927 RepID=A0A0H3D8M1_AMYMU|nr:NACHT domain-containing protein [Amycolatopsis mediterranei]ADJ45889.1 large ATP-binding protein [Amycolatopsis mediterranei U32]AFO77600.1 large ATP-binding protein [Amycolatopsis mediterranei S699]AGT84728.1 large ATP-binding protein [Amycolatopsis mediterranei RB]KDO05425.1 ATP-binding protein [Amycolatopsis mediterranei]KDU88219.1 ATP-binding protein [Amycolatopsis mediterranei]
MLKVGTAVVNSAVKSWLTSRKSELERQSSLAELVQVRMGGGFSRRRFDREIEALVDVVSERLLLVCRQEVPDLDDGERSAALAEVAAAFERANLADADLFEVDVDAAKLAARLRATLPAAAERAGLGEAGTWFHRRVLEECCGYYVRLVVHLTPFAARAGAELLGRVSGLAEQLERVLNRLPAPSLMAPGGTASDTAFRSRYLRQISETLDDLELFGVDTRSYRPRTTLSVAYVSLTVRGAGADLRGPAHEMLSWRADAGRGQDGSVRAEQALATSARILIRGEAGSGKSTLLRWLAVNAARGTFRDELAGLNGYVPFLIKLRSYSGRRLPSPEEFLDGTAQALTALMPSAYVHRQLASGRALVLVDGVDELTADERGAVRAWLKDLCQAFPESRLVLTSRPAAAAETWLSAEGFSSAWIEHMSQADVRALVRHWHKAVRDAGSMPCAEEDLPRYEGVLLSRLDGNAHLRALATTPLLCAMLCALNLDRASFLPRNRLELYVTALSMLLERRDAERRVPASLKIGHQESRQLLRHLAWRLSVNGRSELSREEALRRLAERLATVPRVGHDADRVLEHLLQRSGIVREPTPGRIDFVHRTFQEFLTAEEAADQGDVGLLVQNAHLDQWRDIVVMAAGLANAPLREQLFTGLFDRADAEPRTRRKLRLLAAAATESAPALTVELAERMESALAALIPPRGKAEARSLAAGGEVLLPRLLDTPADLSEAAAAATVRTAALINGPEAWPVLEKFSGDPRPGVQRELIAAWRYFDPDEYAARVLADAPLLDGHLRIEDQALLPAVPKLRRLSDLNIALSDIADLEVLTRLPCLRDAHLSGGFEDLTPLTRCTDLESLFLVSRGAIDPHPLLGVPSLRHLYFLPGVGSQTDLGVFQPMKSLVSLAISRLNEVNDFSALGDLRALTSLNLYHYPDGADFGFLRNLAALRSLDIGRTPEGVGLGIQGGLRQLAKVAPALDWVGFLDVRPLGELGELSRFPALERLSIRRCQVEDLTPLSTVRGLRTLELLAPVNPSWWAQIARMNQLATLEIISSPGGRGDIDLSGLGDARLTVRAYPDRRRIVNAGPGIEVRRG